MISYELIRNGTCQLWNKYADFGYSLGSGFSGFKPFVESTVPSARVTGDTASGLTLEFDDPKDLTMFLLRWT